MIFLTAFTIGILISLQSTVLGYCLVALLIGFASLPAIVSGAGISVIAVFAGYNAGITASLLVQAGLGSRHGGRV